MKLMQLLKEIRIHVTIASALELDRLFIAAFFLKRLFFFADELLYSS